MVGLIPGADPGFGPGQLEVLEEGIETRVLSGTNIGERAVSWHGKAVFTLVPSTSKTAEF